MTLFEECIEVIGIENLVQLDSGSSLYLFSKFQGSFPFTSWGRINWDKMERKKEISNMGEISEFFDSKECYLLWDEASLPVLKTSINKVLQYIDDVTAVSLNTWLLSESKQCVVEFHHDGQIIMGFV